MVLKNKDCHPNMIRKSKDLDGMSIDVAFKNYPSGYKFTAKLRRELWRSHDKKCCYCGVDIETHMDIHIDHFEPKSKITEETIENLVCSCAKCNLIKRDKDLEDFRFCLAVSKSILGGIILPNVAKKIIGAGVDLPIHPKPFYFEEILRGSNE